MCAPAAEVQAAQRAPEKFIPTAVLAYGTASAKVISPADLAKFDMLIVSDHREKTWVRGRTQLLGNPQAVQPEHGDPGVQQGPRHVQHRLLWPTWRLGPDSGLSRARPTAGQSLGVPRDTVRQGSSRFRVQERTVDEPGDADWVNYQWRTIYQEWWGTGRNKGADGVFADNFHYQPPWAGQLLAENTAAADRPSEYFRDGVYDNEKWQQHFRAAMNLIVPGLAAKPESPLYVPNFGYMDRRPEWWLELDKVPTLPSQRCRSRDRPTIRRRAPGVPLGQQDRHDEQDEECGGGIRQPRRRAGRLGPGTYGLRGYPRDHGARAQPAGTPCGSP